MNRKNLVDDQDFLDSRVSLRQIFYLAITGAVVFGTPYIGIGLYWLSGHHDHLGELHGLDELFSIIGEVIAWPALLISNISLR